LLELIRLKQLVCAQPDTFGEIEITRRTETERPSSAEENPATATETPAAEVTSESAVEPSAEAATDATEPEPNHD
jgi:hypothetical protein